MSSEPLKYAGDLTEAEREKLFFRVKEEREGGKKLLPVCASVAQHAGVTTESLRCMVRRMEKNGGKSHGWQWKKKSGSLQYAALSPCSTVV